MTANPLMAGNWKMNLNHQEAWSWSRSSPGPGRQEARLRPGRGGRRRLHRPAVGADPGRRRPAAGRSTARRTSRRTTRAPTRARSRRACWPSSVLLRRGGSQRAPRVPRRGRRGGQRQGAPGARRRHDPIMCVGEGLTSARPASRSPRPRAGRRPWRASPREQVGGLVVAYEPVWAIGTGEVATPEDAQEVCAAIRARSEVHGDAAADGVRSLYGGSVKASNVGGIMAQADVDGCLVGGASLQADEFGASAATTTCRSSDLGTPGRRLPTGTALHHRAS